MIGVAFSPAHITGFFKAELNSEDSLRKGSLGAGFCIQKGVKTTVRVTSLNQGSTKINISTTGFSSEDFQVSEFVTKEFLRIYLEDKNFHIDINHQIEIPVGFGLGSSAAVALSLVYALNQAFKTKIPKEKLGALAHKAEVTCKTGLGDVIGSFYGGFEIRFGEGAPGIGELEKIKTKPLTVFLICFSPISTKQFMINKIDLINGLGGKFVDKLRISKNISEFQDMSYQFAKKIKILTPKMENLIDEFHRNGIKCGVALFGETIFVLTENDKREKIKKILKKHNGEVLESKINPYGAFPIN